MPTYRPVNGRLRQLLDSEDLSASELGRRISVSKEALNRYARNERVMPLPIAYSVAKYFGVSVESLYDWVLTTK